MQLLPYLYKYMGTDYHLIALKNVWLIIQMIIGIDFMNILIETHCWWQPKNANR